MKCKILSKTQNLKYFKEIYSLTKETFEKLKEDE